MLLLSKIEAIKLAGLFRGYNMGKLKKNQKLEIQILPCLFSHSVAKTVRKSQDVRSFSLCLLFHRVYIRGRRR